MRTHNKSGIFKAGRVKRIAHDPLRSSRPDGALQTMWFRVSKWGAGGARASGFSLAVFAEHVKHASHQKLLQEGRPDVDFC